MRVWLVSRCVYRWDIFLHKRTAGIRLRCYGMEREPSVVMLYFRSWYNIATRIETMVLAPIFLRLIVYRFSLPYFPSNVKIFARNITVWNSKSSNTSSPLLIFKKGNRLENDYIYIYIIRISELHVSSFIANILEQLNALIRLYIVKFKYRRY